MRIALGLIWAVSLGVFGAVATLAALTFVSEEKIDAQTIGRLIASLFWVAYIAYIRTHPELQRHFR